MAEFVLLLTVAGVIVLIALLVRARNTSAEVEFLKHRLKELEWKMDALARKDHEEDVEPDTKPPEAPVSEEKAIPEPVKEPTPSGPRPVSKPAVQPPPIPQVAAKVTEPAPKKTVTDAQPTKSFSVSEFLRGMGLWPPEREKGSAELVLMQWWAPRIAGLLAILALIFFAVYVANTPLVKFLEMLAASFGVFGLGLYFARKRPELGNVLVATGLSMIYISSVAGYAVGPVKVVDNPLYGALMQLAALVLNFGMGAWKKERAILILAIIFGYLSSLFAALEGFREAALISSLLIYLAGLFSYRKIGGLTLATLSLAGVYLPLLGFIGIESYKDAAVYPAFGSVIVFLAVTVSVLPACKWKLGEPVFLEARWNRLYQAINTSVALALGYLFVAQFYPLGMTEFYGVMALLFLTWAVVWFFKDAQCIEFHLFFLKGSALASLWLINYLHGDLRWMALAIQVVVLAASVHRSKSPWVEGITLITWFVSFRYFAPTLDHIDPVGSILWFLQLAYFLVSVGSLAFLMAYANARQLVLRRLVYAVPAVVIGVSGIAFAAQSKVSGIDEPAVIALMALVLAAFAVVRFMKAWLPLIAGGILFFVAHVGFWIETSNLMNLLIILGMTAIALAVLLRQKLAMRDLIETLVHIVWVLTVFRYLDGFREVGIYPLMIVAFSGVLFIGGLSPLRRLTEVAPLPLILAVLSLTQADRYPIAIMLVSAAGVGLLASAGTLWPKVNGWVRFLARFEAYWWILNALFIFWTHWVLQASFGPTNQLLVWTALGALYFAAWYWRSTTFSLVGALVCGAIPVFHIVDYWLNPIAGGLIAGAPWAAQVLSAGFCSMTLWIAFGGYSHVRLHERFTEKGQQIFAWACGLTAYVVFAAAFQYPLLGWDRLYTPVLAGFSIGLIVLGIVLKSKPYRYVAMLSFAVPVFRLFVYDIRETLYRIIAFAVLAILLTIVAFLYQKYSARIE